VDAAVALVVPKGVHYFLRRDQVASDQPVSLRIVSCRYCGHLQSLDEPVIYQDVASSATYVSEPLLEARRRQGRMTLANAFAPVEKILEIGCGDGHFLSGFAPHAGTLLGIEPSAENARQARARGITVLETILDEHTILPGAPFDAFFAFHVLEHVPDVKAFLRGIRNNLRSGAVGCVEVPSTEAAYEHSRYGHFMADHLSYFFVDTLRRALEESGFEVLSLEREWEGEHLVAYVRARAEGAHLAVTGWISSTTDRLAAFVRRAASERRTVALWGASNPILPVLMHLPRELPFIVVDKAPTKHGLFAPGSHVEIHSPDELRLRKIDYVVITAPRFFDEIRGELSAGFEAAVETIDADVGVADRICRLVWPR
jgi:2-polyprenyl-3-methyl-5-hydroxy-6-metoxy-1,4-benzoquinol methylase